MVHLGRPKFTSSDLVQNCFLHKILHTIKTPKPLFSYLKLLSLSFNHSYISDQYFSLISANNQDQPSLVINKSNSKIYLGPTCPPNNFDKTIFGFLR
ncbi:hypothetical protein PPACK8108_LOCUS1654, partial [Phakopsora pachyrhizi]